MTNFAQTRALPDLMCRNLRHAWNINKFRAATYEEAQARGLLKWDQVVVREVSCDRCGTEKVEFFARDTRMNGFDKVKGGYKYPEGYLFRAEEPQDTPPDRWDYFSELFVRIAE